MADKPTTITFELLRKTAFELLFWNSSVGHDWHLLNHDDPKDAIPENILVSLQAVDDPRFKNVGDLIKLIHHESSEYGFYPSTPQPTNTGSRFYGRPSAAQIQIDKTDTGVTIKVLGFKEFKSITGDVIPDTYTFEFGKADNAKMATLGIAVMLRMAEQGIFNVIHRMDGKEQKVPDEAVRAAFITARAPAAPVA